jgi:V/A-type H+-transporting ATPase subunit C
MSEITSSYPYASARVKALEGKLITRDRIARVIEAKDFDAAMRSLGELGYGQPAAVGASFEQLISKELAETDVLLGAISPSETFTRIMRTERDFYNMKVLIKLLMQDKPLDSMMLTPGNIPVKTLRRALSENSYRDLPDTMTAGMHYIDRKFAIAADASIVGIALDRAYAKEIRGLLREFGDPLVTEYFQAFFDLSNFIALMRVRASDYNRESFERVFVKGGTIDRSVFAKAFDVADENVLAAALTGEARSAMGLAMIEYQKTGSLYMLEKARDDYLLSLLEKARNDMFGIGPLMGYYIAKQREAAAVRMVMTGKLGGISAETVTERLKELY